MKKIITNDESETFFNEEFNETYHSITGAVEESIKKFILPAISKKVDGKKIKILDICFGLGYNSGCAIDYFEDCEITGIEIDEDIIKKINEVNPNFKSYNEIKELINKKQTKHIKLIIGDALIEIKKLENNYFDIVFLDPFSPKKAPELWTEEFIKNIYSKMKKWGVLTTYSCASIVRKNLKNAGFCIENGPKVGRRGPSTVAVKC